MPSKHSTTGTTHHSLSRLVLECYIFQAACLRVSENVFGFEKNIYGNRNDLRTCSFANRPPVPLLSAHVFSIFLNLQPLTPDTVSSPPPRHSPAHTLPSPHTTDSPTSLKHSSGNVRPLVSPYDIYLQEKDQSL